MTRYEQLKRDLLQNFKEFQDIKAPGGSDLANEIVASKMARSIVDAIPASTFNVVGEMPCSQINVYDKNVGDLFTTIDAGNLFGAVTLTVNKGWIVWWSGDRFVKVYEGVQGGGSSVTVDQALDITSANPIANAPVAAAIVEVNRRIDELEPGENVQSDWSQDDSTAPDYIKNKPETMAPSSHNHSASDITSGSFPIARGGTGATTAANARANLGAEASSNKVSSWSSTTNNTRYPTEKLVKDSLNEKYAKPSGGIPKSDLASAVQTSLGKADTALQEHQSLDGYAKTSVIADHAFGTSEWIDIGYFSLSSTWQSSSIIVNREFYGAQKATQDIISCSRDTSSGDRAVVSRVNLQERGNQASYDWKYAIVNGAVHVYVLDSYGTRHSRFEVTPIGSSGTFTVDAVYNADVTGANDMPIGGHVSRADKDGDGNIISETYAKTTDIPSVPTASTSTPLMDGTADSGSGTTYACGDHRHPSDTSKADNTPTFLQAATRANLAGSGETMPTILGKIKKWFADLKTVAFTGSYSDLSGKPTIPAAANDATLTVKMNGYSKGTFTSNASADKTINLGTVITDVSGKADKVNGATANNFAALDADGNLKDSGKNVSDLKVVKYFNLEYVSLSERAEMYAEIASLIDNRDFIPVIQSSKGSLLYPCWNHNGTNNDLMFFGVSRWNTDIDKTIIEKLILKSNGTYDTYLDYVCKRVNKPDFFTSGHLASLDSNGDLADSGKAPSDFESSDFSKCQENASGKWYKVATITQKGTNAYCLMCAKIEIMAGDNLFANNSSHMSNFATYDLMIRRNGTSNQHPSGASGNTFLIKKNILYSMESVKISAGFVSKFSGGKLSADIWVKGNTDSTSNYSNNILARVIFAGCGLDTTDKGVTVTYYDQTSGSDAPDTIFREATRKVIAATSA